MELYVLIALFWIGVSIVWGLVARRKGRSFLAIFALSIFVTPIIGMIVALLLQPTDAVKMSVTTGGINGPVGPVPCPFCKEQIRPDAVVCKHCGKDVEPGIERLLEEQKQSRAATREAESVAFLEQERQRQLRQKRRKQFWTTGRKIGVIAGSVIAVAGLITLLTVLNSTAPSRREAAIEAAIAKLAASGEWGRIIESCGEPPAEIQNVQVLDSDKEYSFDVIDEWGVDTGPILVGDAQMYLSCLDGTLADIKIDTFMGTAEVTASSRILDILVMKGGSAEERYEVTVSVPEKLEVTSTGTELFLWHVTVSKTGQFAVLPSGN
jgi:hypothetical protein